MDPLHNTVDIGLKLILGYVVQSFQSLLDAYV
jgi:hypothetical protein